MKLYTFAPFYNIWNYDDVCLYSCCNINTRRMWKQKQQFLLLWWNSPVQKFRSYIFSVGSARKLQRIYYDVMISYCRHWHLISTKFCLTRDTVNDTQITARTRNREEEKKIDQNRKRKTRTRAENNKINLDTWWSVNICGFWNWTTYYKTIKFLMLRSSSKKHISI